MTDVWNLKGIMAHKISVHFGASWKVGAEPAAPADGNDGIYSNSLLALAPEHE